MDTAELSRLIENVIRIGTVSEVDHARARCRVLTGEVPTGWLKWIAHRAGETRSWSAPTVGEQVLILSPSGELAGGIVITGIYRDAHPAPSASPTVHVTEFPDGARISYDHASGALEATGIVSASIQASGHVLLDTPLTRCTGDLTVDGLFMYNGGATGTGDHTHSGGELSSNGKVLHTHKHGPDGLPE